MFVWLRQMRRDKGVALLIVCCCSFPGVAMASMIDEWEPVESFRGVPLKTSPFTGGDVVKIWEEPVTKMRFSRVPGGCFEMGSPLREMGRETDEGPQHEVCLSGFWMGQSEVTRTQWQQIMQGHPAQLRKSSNDPVDQVSWQDATRYLQKLSDHHDGRYRFRLPTEAEWEYACRSGGRSTRYAGTGDVGQIAWFRENSGRKAAKPVMTQQPNGLNFYDMSGNLWEWVQDFYHEEAYRLHARYNPRLSGAMERYRVIRGGSWNDKANSVRCSNRGYELFSEKSRQIGFRAVRSD